MYELQPEDPRCEVIPTFCSFSWGQLVLNSLEQLMLAEAASHSPLAAPSLLIDK